MRRLSSRHVVANGTTAALRADRAKSNVPARSRVQTASGVPSDVALQMAVIRLWSRKGMPCARSSHVGLLTPRGRYLRELQKLSRTQRQFTTRLPSPVTPSQTSSPQSATFRPNAGEHDGECKSTVPYFPPLSNPGLSMLG